jgi:uncharacterized protein with GYD domain
MQTYIILTKFAPGAFATPLAFRKASVELSKKLKHDCPGVRWKASYATLGRYDVIDVVAADRPEDVHRAAILINTHAHASTETMLATPWHEYIDRNHPSPRASSKAVLAAV